jgi:hypothetical protein
MHTRCSAPKVACKSYIARPQIKHDYPLNLSISLSGGKETNKDSLSSGERTGKSPKPNPADLSARKCGVWFNPYGTPELF